jgi:DNA-nicking Smr family endonuclease
VKLGGGSVCVSDPEDDRRLFREAVRGVKPLDRPARVHERPKPRPAARFARAERLAVLEESLREVPLDPDLEGGDTLVFRRPGVRPAVLRRLRRGEYRVQGEIDLHGLTVRQAQEALREFLAEALLRQWRCVRIVHGKGLRSGHRGPVLKATVASVLRRLGPVLAFVSARPADGGTGAVYVLLSS